MQPLHALPLETLRQRSSTKWRKYGDDVLPLFVAETDYPTAPEITRALTTAIEIGDTGYTPPEPGISAAFVDFAQRRYGWKVDPTQVRTTGDVMMGVVEIIRALTTPGDRVIITPPVYPPFAICIQEAGALVEEVALSASESAWALDLAGIETALADGASGVLLCNPHNPTGTTHSPESLAALANIADRHGAWVLSDEIHAPLTLPGGGYTPFLAASETAARVGYAVTSASKAFNLAGLKCAQMITASERTADVVRHLPLEVEWRTGLFGAIAAVAAFDPASDEWLDRELLAINNNHQRLAELVSEHLPRAKCISPDAGFLAWVDLSAYGWGQNPAAHILESAKVAFASGPDFGKEGIGHVRINVACSPEVLTEAITRVAALAAE